MYNPADVRWDVLNNIMSLYYVCIYQIFGLNALDSKYPFNLIYLLRFGSLTYFDFISWIATFWSCGPHPLLYLSEYNTSLLSRSVSGTCYACEWMYHLKFSPLTLSDILVGFQPFKATGLIPGHMSMNTIWTHYFRKETISKGSIIFICWDWCSWYFWFYQLDLGFWAHVDISP
jgi:hypothetical protein